MTRVVQQQALSPRRDVVTAGDDSQQTCLDGVRAVALHQMGTWRRDANRRFLSDGPPRPGPGRPKPYDGKGHWSELSRVERVASSAAGIVLDTQVVNHGPFTRHVRVVRVVETCTHRFALLLSPDIAHAAAHLSGYDHARFQSAFLCRDAKPLTGLSDGQARSPAKLAFHVKMSVMAPYIRQNPWSVRYVRAEWSRLVKPLESPSN